MEEEDSNGPSPNKRARMDCGSDSPAEASNGAFSAALLAYNDSILVKEESTGHYHHVSMSQETDDTEMVCDSESTSEVSSAIEQSVDLCLGTTDESPHVIVEQEPSIAITDLEESVVSEVTDKGVDSKATITEVSEHFNECNTVTEMHISSFGGAEGDSSQLVPSADAHEVTAGGDSGFSLEHIRCPTQTDGSQPESVHSECLDTPPCTPANSPEPVPVVVISQPGSHSPHHTVNLISAATSMSSPGFTVMPEQQGVEGASPELISSLPSVQTLIQHRNPQAVSSTAVNPSLGSGMLSQHVLYSDLSTLSAVANIQNIQVGSPGEGSEESGWETQISHPGTSQANQGFTLLESSTPVVHVVQQTYQPILPGPHQILNWQTGSPLVVTTPVSKKMVTSQTAMPCASQNLSAYHSQLKKQTYNGTPHPVVTGRTILPSPPLQRSAAASTPSTAETKTYTPARRVTFNTPQSGRSLSTPLSRMSQLSLNSSGSEEERSPPEGTFHLPNIPVPYNTPVGGRSNTKIPSAADLQAALMRTRREPLDPCDGPGREQHNAKERARRARIKCACDNLRDLMPGNMARTDKATLMELSVEYIKHLRAIVGDHYDKEFLKKTTPYLNMELD